MNTKNKKKSNRRGMNPSIAFPTVEKLIYDAAHEGVRKWGLTLDDALAEAYWGFMRACLKWNPNNKQGAKFSTWCRFVMDKKIATIGMKRFTVHRIEGSELNEEITEGVSATVPETPFKNRLQDMSDSLSDDAREIIALLCDMPTEIRQYDTPKRMLKGVRDLLVGRGRSRAEVDEAYLEIVETLQSA